MRRLLLALAPLLALPAPPAPAAEDAAYDLALGDPARKDRQAPLLLDGVTDTRTGEVLTPADLPPRVKDVRLLLVGENHTSMEVHRAQLRVLEELKRSGREVLLGLEMFPFTDQKVLDEWNAGKLDEARFLEAARWFKSWGYNWSYYRDIFAFARAASIPVFGVNTPREVITAVRKKGFAGLTAEERALVPDSVDTKSEEHRTLFKASFGPDASMHAMMTGEVFEGMFRAQCTWDATMAANAVKALKERGGKDAVMVVLVGEGHVAYGLGIERQARKMFDGKVASVIPVSVLGEKQKPLAVRASYADFLWGVLPEEESLFPSLGLSTRDVPGGETLPVIAVEKEGVAAAAGFKPGDEIVSLDGTPVKDRETHARLMSVKRWGDASTYVVKRGAGSLTIRALLRRKAPEPCPVPEKTPAPSK